ncbi:MAG: hypothetical protein ABWZ98_04285 [Nakamurella sp.]
MTNPERSKQRRQRRLYAAIAGWALLGAASTGIVACSNANAAETTAAGSGESASTAASQSPSAAQSAGEDASSPSQTSQDAAPSSAAAPAPGSATATAPTSATSAPSSEPAAPSSATAAAGEVTSAAQTSTYSDGTYTAAGSYSSPGGTESMSITLTLADDTVTDASAVGEATNGPSEQYQSEFISNFAALVVGKDIDTVSLDKVAGSSLTSSGFNAAVETIKSDALA